MLKTPRNASIHNGTASSKAAADRVRVFATGLRLQVENHIRKQGPRGATDKEIQAALQISGDTERPRRRELQQAGRITAAAETRNGCKVWVWVDRADAPITAKSVTPPPDPAAEVIRTTPPDAHAAEISRQRQRRSQIDADKAELATLEDAHGKHLDTMTQAELQELFDTEPDAKNREALQRRVERFGRHSSFVRRRLLTLLEQQTNSDCRR